MNTMRWMQIGRLMVNAGILSEQDLEEAVSVAIDLGSPLYKVFIQANFVGRVQLEAATDAYQMVHDGAIDQQTAIKALNALAQKGVTLEQALSECNAPEANARFQSPVKQASSLRLGELLRLCGLVSTEQLEQALAVAQWRDSRIGETLVSLCAIDQFTLECALQIQSSLRKGTMQVETAAVVLQYCSRMRCGIAEALVLTDLEAKYAECRQPDAQPAEEEQPAKTIGSILQKSGFFKGIERKAS